MHKKLIISSFVALSLLAMSSRVSAENSIQQDNADTTDATIAGPTIDLSVADKLNKTSMRFCIDGFTPDKLNRIGKLTLQPGKSEDICMVFINNLPEDEEFSIGFSEGTKDKGGAVACDQNMDNNKFLHMVYAPDKIKKIVVASGNNIVTHFKIKVPATATGNVYGCVAYYLSGSYSKQTGEMFGLLVRKVAPIEITVTGSVYTLGRRDDLKDAYTTNKNRILEVIIGVLAIWIIISIAQTTKKKEKHHSKNK